MHVCRFELIPVRFSNDTKPMNTLCGQSTERLMLQQVEVLLTHVVSIFFKVLRDVTAVANHTFPSRCEVMYLLLMAWTVGPVFQGISAGRGLMSTVTTATFHCFMLSCKSFVLSDNGERAVVCWFSTKLSIWLPRKAALFGRRHPFLI
jgi:hypothetical protein